MKGKSFIIALAMILYCGFSHAQTYEWDGSGAWISGGSFSPTPPGSTHDVVFTDSYDAANDIFGWTGDCATMTINASIEVTMSSALTCSGALTLNAGAILDMGTNNISIGSGTMQNAAQIIQTGPASTFSSSGTFTVNRTLRAVAHDSTNACANLLGSPIDNVQFTSLNTHANTSPYKDSFQLFSTSNFSFISGIANGQFQRATGYNIPLGTGIAGDANSNQVSFSGNSFYNGQYLKNLIYDSSDDDLCWNLLSNPYLSQIDIYQFHNGVNNDDIKPGVLIWNGSGYNALATGSIPVAQGFFVQSTSSNSVTFLNGYRTTSGSNNLAKNETPPKVIRLSVTEGDRVAEKTLLTLIFNDSVYNDTIGVNGYNPKADFNYWGMARGALMYHWAPDSSEAIMLKYLPEFNELQTQYFDLGLYGKTIGAYTVAIDDISGFNFNHDVYLVDRLLDDTVNLNNGNYSFPNAQSENINHGRFTLIFGEINTTSAKTIVGQEALVKIWKSNRNTISLDAPELLKSVAIFDINGALVHESNLNDKKQSVEVSELASGLYIIQVKTASGNIATKKITL